MPHDFLEELEALAAQDVPAAPLEFDRQLHRRLNQALLLQQVLDLVLRAMPWAIVHFARAVAGAIDYSLTGRFHDPEDEERNSL